MRLLTFGLLISLATGGAQIDFHGIPVTCSSTLCTYSLTFENGPPETHVVLTGAPWSGRREVTGYISMVPEPMVYRDSEGRLRTERTISLRRNPAATQKASEALFIEILDPVASVRYVLDPVLRVAHRTSYHPEAVVKYAPSPTSDKRSETTDALGNTTVQEPLASTQISGVAVAGHRTIRRAPATASGGERVTLAYSETWTDPQTGIVVMGKSTDSAGHLSERRIANYSHAEPDPALFRVPDGYRIVDETDSFEVVHPYHGEPASNGIKQARTVSEVLNEVCDEKACNITFTPGTGRDYRLITGAPYSGTRVFDVLPRKLANGTTTPEISSEITTYRDMEGRLKTIPAEMNVMDSRIQEIDDPVAGCRYLIDTVNRVAYKILMTSTKVPYRIHEIQRQPLPNQTEAEDLAARTISGVQAVGYRTTQVMPPLTGADKPAVTTVETWTDLVTGVDLVMVRNAPEGEFRQAERDYREGNPDAAELQPPAGYRVIEETGAFSFSIPRLR